MCQGMLLFWDPYDGLPFIGNIYLVLGPEEAFSKKRNLSLWINHLKTIGHKKIHETTFFFPVWMRWICMNAPWKKHFGHSIRGERHFGCISRHAGAIHPMFLQALDPVWYRADPPWVGSTYDAGVRFIHWDVVLAKVSFPVISEWRQSRAL